VETAAFVVCTTGGGATVRLTVALVPAVEVAAASVDDACAEDSLVGADEEDAEDATDDSEAELAAVPELELEPGGATLTPPLGEPGLVLGGAFAAAAL